MNDPQTSGGLLLAVPADRQDEAAAAALAHGALCAVEIGEVRSAFPDDPLLVFPG